MLDAFSDINWLAVVLSLVISVVLAGLYFGLVAARAYTAVLGREGLDTPRPGPVAAVGPIVCILVTILTSAVLVAALDLTSAGDAVVFAVVVGVGYQLAMTFQIAINPNFPHPIRYGLLNAPYFLVTSLVSSLLLVLI